MQRKKIMHYKKDKRFIGLFILFLLVGFTVIVATSLQKQTQLGGAASLSGKGFTGTGTSGRHISQGDFEDLAILPVPQLSSYPIPPLSREDMDNYILGGTRGGTATAGVENSTAYMHPGSRMPTSGENEYDAAVALIYYYQIKAHLAYRDIVFNFNEGDKVKDIVDNIASGTAVRMRTEEADTLLKVAVVYKGDLCGFGEYNNPGMKQLLIKWGRPDLAAEPGVGETDIESIGLVAQAIDEEPNVQKRREWLAEIYVFYDNVNPRSPSGAVPQLREYQCAIDITQDGTFDRLIDNYVNNIKTSNLINPTPGGVGYPHLAPLALPTFGQIGGTSPTIHVTNAPTQEPQPTNIQPTRVVVTPQPPSPVNPGAAEGLIGLFIQFILLVIALLLGRG